jgi:hypothetical protein
MKLKCAITVAALSLVSSAAYGGVLAGPITNPANAHVYFLLGSNTWSNSEQEARRLGGHLATVNDTAENRWIANTFFPLTGVSYASLWIGFNDADVDGQFVWASHDPVSFTYWYSGQPSNGLGGSEDYATIRHPSEAPPIGSWNDLPDYWPEVFGVVEVEPEARLAIEVASVALTWFAAANEVYQIQYRSSLTTNAWMDLGFPIVGSGAPLTVIDTAVHEPRRLYRVRLVP